ncbi:DUF421 domain-containing protein [Brevibacillus humidisoli]|uniref:DUF421 domain-containing protein n=1 Tax=Brevibacillus humidisoli TaxID=2895522 RepID=UPI001E48CE9E|nr:DUF421 domain-containing protein [Brevibacillus humidisoli]UFJ39826.1 DUF421 domain-containing protein [Brevibacillus humidisoli]
MLLYIGKVILLFLVSVVVIRFMGKATLAQLTPHDLTAIIFLATLAVSPIASEHVREAVAGIVTVSIIHVLFAKLTLFRWINRLVIGHPTILVKHGKLIKANLRQSRYSLVELLASMRSAGYPDIRDVQYAILEPTGEISILPREDVIPVTPRHLDMKVEYQGLPIAVVVEGKVQERNLRLINRDERWLQKQLKLLGVTDVRDVFYAAVRDTDHSLTVDTGAGEDAAFGSSPAEQ